MPLADTLCDAVDIRPGAKVLDVATGTGHVALAAARRFCETTGVDYVPALIEKARARSDAEGLADGVDLKITPGSVRTYFLSPQHFADFFIENYGPTLKAYESLPEEGRSALRSDYIEVAEKRNSAKDGTAAIDFDYIAAVAKKK